MRWQRRGLVAVVAAGALLALGREAHAQRAPRTPPLELPPLAVDTEPEPLVIVVEMFAPPLVVTPFSASTVVRPFAASAAVTAFPSSTAALRPLRLISSYDNDDSEEVGVSVTVSPAIMRNYEGLSSAAAEVRVECVARPPSGAQQTVLTPLRVRTAVIR